MKCWMKTLGWCVLGIGLAIILTVVLPSDVWWVLLGAVMVVLGIILLRGRR